MNARPFTRVATSRLRADDLFSCLVSFGFPSIPVTHSTRSLLERKLFLISGAAGDNVRPPIVQAESQPINLGRVASIVNLTLLLVFSHGLVRLRMREFILR